MNKLLSIIIPSYNMEKYLPKCLGSLIIEDQDMFQRLDVIVVNDGSKDQTSAIAHEFEAKYPDVVRVIDKANGNYGSCINAGLKIAKGEFVRILDADDTYDTIEFERYLSRLMQILPDVDVILSDYVIVNAEGGVRKTMSYPLNMNQCMTPDALASWDRAILMHAICYRLQLVKQISYRQTEGISYTDNEWVCYPLAYAKKCQYLKFVVYRYFLGCPGQTMQPSVCRKNYIMIEKVADAMFSCYDHHAQDKNMSLRYFQRQLRQMITTISNMYVSALPIHMTPRYFFLLREQVQQYPFLQNVLDKDTIFASSCFAFHHKRFLVRHPHAAIFILPILRLYLLVREIV